MKVRARGVLVVAALTLGACSGDSAAPATTAPDATSPPASTGASTTAAATTTEATTAPDMTSAPTTSPPTTIPPSTPPATIPADLAQAQQDVINATVAAWQAYLDATRNPRDDAVLERLTATNSGPTLERRLQRIVEVAASGVASVENPNTPASIDIYEDTVMLDPIAGTASVEYCRIGSDLGVEIGGNPDGTDKIVVNEVNAYRERADLVFVAGHWTDDDGAQLQKFPGATTCGA